MCTWLKGVCFLFCSKHVVDFVHISYILIEPRRHEYYVCGLNLQDKSLAEAGVGWWHPNWSTTAEWTNSGNSRIAYWKSERNLALLETLTSTGSKSTATLLWNGPTWGKGQFKVVRGSGHIFCIIRRSGFKEERAIKVYLYNAWNEVEVGVKILHARYHK